MFNPFHEQLKIKGNRKNVPRRANNMFCMTPIVFETKKQYVNQYLHNQEKARGHRFTPKQEQTFKKNELHKMKNVVARYTTNSNPYMPKETVFFTDRKISPDRLNIMADHEFNHFINEPFEPRGSKNMLMKIPTETAYKMREKNTNRWPGNSDNMNIKRPENTMNVLRKATREGTIDPIPVEDEDYAKGFMAEGRHRIIVAKEQNKPEVEIDIYSHKVPSISEMEVYDVPESDTENKD